MKKVYKWCYVGKRDIEVYSREFTTKEKIINKLKNIFK